MENGEKFRYNDQITKLIMSSTHPAAGPAPEAKAMEGVRDWILLVALTDKRILADEWLALDEDKAATVVQLIGASALPQELLEVAAKDTRPQVQAALQEGGVMEHSQALTVADWLGARNQKKDRLVSSARAGVIGLLKGGQDRILRPEEIKGICGIARDAVQPDTLAAVMAYVQRLPEVASAALQNPLVTGLSSNDAHAAKLAKQYRDRSAQLEAAKRIIIRPLIESMTRILRNGSSEKAAWGTVLVQVYKLVSGSTDLKELLEKVLKVARSSPEATIAFIEDEEMDDATFRSQILPIAEVVRPHGNDPKWISVFRSLRRNRNGLYKGAIWKELSAQIRMEAEREH